MKRTSLAVVILLGLIGMPSAHAQVDDRALRLGILSMTLTHFRGNNWADSATAAPEHNGLTDFGKSVVREMNRIGMIVDVSHVSDKTFWDALEASKAPVFASHSSCRALANIPRNMTDEMIVALAKKGGVMQINFGCDFLSQKSADATAQRRPEMTKAMAELQEK